MYSLSWANKLKRSKIDQSDLMSIFLIMVYWKLRGIPAISSPLYPTVITWFYSDWSALSVFNRERSSVYVRYLKIRDRWHVRYLNVSYLPD